jgi:diguanylate cyclase (GGDEF)-like protein
MNRLQVLIIEDDIDTATYYQHMLTLLGHEPEIVLSAKAALTRLAGTVPHLILLDLHLGSEVDGEDILYQIRSNPRLDRTRVIVITAYPVMTRVIANLEDLILIKPVEYEQLKDLVSRITSPEYNTKRLSFRDPVTELFNREFLYTRLEHAYERAKRRPEFLYGVAVFSLHGEDQKSLEAQRAAWNRLLQEVAERLLSQLRPTDTLTRLSGWKFAALVEELKTKSDIQSVIHRLQARLLEPYLIDKEHYLFEVSCGAVVYDRWLQRPRELLDQAERALEQARASGLPSVITDPILPNQE